MSCFIFLSNITLPYCNDYTFFHEKDAGDGKGTAKALLDEIAEKESEAQKSFMHR